MQIPNHTQIPNIILDNMKNLTSAEFKVFCAICRKTIGWHKTTDRISYSQLVEMTGLTINTLRPALKSLHDKKIIKQEDTKQGYRYDIGFTISKIDIAKTDIAENDTTISKIDIAKTDIAENDTTISKIDTKVAKIDTKLYQKLPPQKIEDTNKKDTNKKDTNKKESKEVALIIEFWNKMNLPECKNITADVIKIIEKTLKAHEYKYIKDAIENFDEGINDPDYFDNYKWDLCTFLTRKRGYTEWQTDGTKWKNYVAELNKKNQKKEEKGGR